MHLVCEVDFDVEPSKPCFSSIEIFSGQPAYRREAQDNVHVYGLF